MDGKKARDIGGSVFYDYSSCYGSALGSTTDIYKKSVNGRKLANILVPFKKIRGT
jgi:hypothetical protein